MSRLHRFAAARWCAAAISCVVLVAHGETDRSFLLTAHASDLDTYFPSYLANGYLSTMTSPRGTESNLAYVVAFMDYAKEDIARPAAIPGWSGINYSTGKSTAGQFWLNDGRLDPKALEGYQQTLNLREATLTTSYRFTDASKGIHMCCSFPEPRLPTRYLLTKRAKKTRRSTSTPS